MSEANDRQIGGDHYRKHGATGEQHWDRAARLGLSYFQACITKYVERCWDKGGIQDLEKARHYLDKYIEISKAKQAKEYAENEECTELSVNEDNMLCSVPTCAAYAYTPAKLCRNHLGLNDSPSRIADDAPNYEENVGSPDGALRSAIAHKDCILCGVPAGTAHLETCTRYPKPPTVIAGGGSRAGGPVP